MSRAANQIQVPVEVFAKVLGPRQVNQSVQQAILLTWTQGSLAAPLPPEELRAWAGQAIADAAAWWEGVHDRPLEEIGANIAQGLDPAAAPHIDGARLQLRQAFYVSSWLVARKSRKPEEVRQIVGHIMEKNLALIEEIAGMFAGT